MHDEEPVHALRQRAKEARALPILESVEHGMRGAADEIEPAIAQVFVRLGDRVEELELRVRQEAHFYRGDRRKVGGRNEIGDRDADGHGAFIPAAATASFHSHRSSRMVWANSVGALHRGSTPILSRRAVNPASLQPAAISRAIRSTTTGG